MRRNIYLSILLAALVVAIAVCCVSAVTADDEVHFADPVLEEVVRAKLGLDPADPITRAAVETITALDASRIGVNPKIEDLAGIEALKNLVDLQLEDNRITVIGPLGTLTGLKVLNLRDNRNIADISPLASLNALEELSLRRNSVANIGPLAGCRNLIELNLRRNSIVDISAIASLASLEDLNLRENQVTDISPLAGLRNLTERLYLADNPVVEYWPVARYYDRIEDKDFALEVPRVLFSSAGGFYSSAFQLTLTSTDPALTIYYTLDGSEPVAGAPGTHVYASPVTVKSRAGQPNVFSAIDTTSPEWAPPSGEVFKGTPVRARVYCGSLPWPSAVDTNTYFVDRNIKDRYSLPVISLTSDTDSLFGYVNGIYVMGKIYDDNYDDTVVWWRRPANYHQRSSDAERPVNVEYFEADGTPGFSMGAGARIHGGATRAYRQKSLRLYFSSTYDSQSRIEYDLFPGLMKPHSEEPLQEFKRIILRNSGNDWGKSMFRDALTQALVSGTDLDTQAYRPAIVFLNGEYWGIHNIRERQDDWYLQLRYNSNRSNFVMLSGNGTVEEGNPGDEKPYKDLLAYVNQNDVSKPEHYLYVNTQMDIDSFIDFYITNIYVANTDWPQNNTRFWRFRNDAYDPGAPYGLDGRWRWMLYDTDFGFGLYGAEKYKDNSLRRVLETGEGRPPGWSTFLFRSLMKNADFKKAFVDRFLFHLEKTFEPAAVIRKIDEMSRVLSPMMREHSDRWAGPGIYRWEQQLDWMRTFAAERPAYVICHLNRELDLDIPNRKHEVTALAGPGGTISPSGKLMVVHCGEVTFEITPHEGYEVSDILVDGKSVGPARSYTLGRIVSSHTVEAVFTTAPATTFYFAEGTCRPGFDSYICVMNPGSEAAEVTVTYMKGDGATDTETLNVDPNSRSTVNVKDRLGEGDDPAHDFSCRVESSGGQAIVAERPVYFNYKQDKPEYGWTGGHNVMGTTAPATTFYFAEGTCRPGFDSYICVMNPGSEAAEVTVTYMKGDGATDTETLNVGPNSRSTVNVKDRLGEGDDAAHDFSCRVESSGGRPIVVERPVYFNYKRDKPEYGWTGGHNVMGTTAPATTFYFAEGTTRDGFDEYMCVSNPGEEEAKVRMDFLHPDGQVTTTSLDVAPASRSTLFVPDVVSRGIDVSARVESNRPVIVERPVYFSYRMKEPGYGWTGGHNVIGF